MRRGAQVVAIMGGNVARRFYALFPLATFAVLFYVANLRYLGRSSAIAQFGVLLPENSVRPAGRINVVFRRRTVAVVARPYEGARASSQPFVANALYGAFRLGRPIVRPGRSSTRADFARANANDRFVCFSTVRPWANFCYMRVSMSPAPRVGSICFY